MKLAKKVQISKETVKRPVNQPEYWMVTWQIINQGKLKIDSTVTTTSNQIKMLQVTSSTFK